jgi:hypothetical protein
MSQQKLNTEIRVNHRSMIHPERDGKVIWTEEERHVSENNTELYTYRTRE